ncbi:MAG TPA: universal stress protein [Candidatus Binataceae bacterium]|nr:universal stress protein [Candidatus Binataceae bacterium]
MTIKRILVPTDFSEPSLKALDFAIDFTRAHNAELLLLHVVEPIRHTRMMLDVSEILEHHRAEAAEKLTGLEQRTRRRHRKCRSEVHFGIPYDVIADIAKKWKADLIIIATHGYTGLYHLFLGSVAERVVRIASCPVLTVRAPETPVPRRRRRSPKRTSRSSRRA